MKQRRTVSGFVRQDCWSACSPFRDNSSSPETEDAMAILARHGMNTVRLRLWNQPGVEAYDQNTTLDPYTPYCNLTGVQAMARRARSQGLQVRCGLVRQSEAVLHRMRCGGMAAGAPGPTLQRHLGRPWPPTQTGGLAQPVPHAAYRRGLFLHTREHRIALRTRHPAGRCPSRVNLRSRPDPIRCRLHPPGFGDGQLRRHANRGACPQERN
jgi:hypothetical protein